jgi:hypothetical protein
MTTLHEYEAWLDELDKKLFVKNNAIYSEFGPGFSVALSACRTEDEIIDHSVELARTLDQHLFSLPIKYLIERFVRLVVNGLQLKFNSEELASKANQVVSQRHSVWVPTNS